MKIQQGDSVKRIEDRPQVLAAVIGVVDGPMGAIAELSYEEGGSGWWPVDSLRAADETAP
jgi:hypothetical protein